MINGREGDVQYVAKPSGVWKTSEWRLAGITSGVFVIIDWGCFVTVDGWDLIARQKSQQWRGSNEKERAWKGSGLTFCTVALIGMILTLGSSLTSTWILLHCCTPQSTTWHVYWPVSSSVDCSIVRSDVCESEPSFGEFRYQISLRKERHKLNHVYRVIDNKWSMI